MWPRNRRIPDQHCRDRGRDPDRGADANAPDSHAQLFVKLEAFNPGGSVKDRIGVSMIEAAEREGMIEPGRTTIVEATSGNTGIALAFVCAAKGYELVLTMPQGMSREREGLLRLYGASVEITESLGGMNEAVDAARAMASNAEVFLPDQFSNPANPEIHRLTTGPEIWDALDGAVDVFVAGVGTGGRSRAPGRCSSRAIQLSRGRGRAEGVGGAVGRTAGAAQDPGNWRRVRPHRAQPRCARRDDPGRATRKRSRPPVSWPIARGYWRESRVGPRCGRRSRWRAGRSRGARGSSRSCRIPVSGMSRPRSSRRRPARPV